MRAGALPDFPHEVDHNGVCSKFDRETRECTIYEDRPMICRVDDFYHKYMKHQTDLKYWYAYNASMCDKMINQAGLDKSYLVKPKLSDLSDPESK